MHQVEPLIDVFNRQSMRYHRVTLDFPVHVAIHYFGNICALLRSAKGCAFPDAARDKLKGTSGDFFARFSATPITTDTNA